jgi:hypothetical protein
MINYKYDRKENEIRVEITEFCPIADSCFPLKVVFREMVSGKDAWSADLWKGHWCTWKGGSTGPYDTVIYNAKGERLMSRSFSVIDEGDFIEKNLWYFLESCEERPWGMVIGSHDGAFGHWVHPVDKGKTDAVLVEGSDAQFGVLKHYYEGNVNAKCIQEIVTTDGSEVEWYEGDKGYTNTILKEVIGKFLEDSQITKSIRKSISINDLIERESQLKGKDPDWIHFDVEGLDADLIMAMKHYPNVIIFELAHLPSQKLSDLQKWFGENGYEWSTSEDGLDAIAFRKI